MVRAETDPPQGESRSIGEPDGVRPDERSSPKHPPEAQEDDGGDAGPHPPSSHVLGRRCHAAMVLGPEAFASPVPTGPDPELGYRRVTWQGGSTRRGSTR
jgi:hypothetical protein